MRMEHLSAEEGLRQGLALPFALIRSLGKVTLGLAPASVEASELVEAVFFGDGTELRVFYGEDDLRAVHLFPEENDIFLEKKYLLEKDFGSVLTVKQYLKADEDGQMTVDTTCLAAWEG